MTKRPFGIQDTDIDVEVTDMYLCIVVFYTNFVAATCECRRHMH